MRDAGVAACAVGQLQAESQHAHVRLLQQRRTRVSAGVAHRADALLGDAVQGAADAFLTTWEQRTLVLRDQASGHADSLAQTMYDFLTTDAESVQATQQLLLWEDRNTPPVQAVGP